VSGPEALGAIGPIESSGEADIPMVKVNQGGNSTMLGHWRLVLKQAEESAKAGRFDEALELAARPDVADHRQAVQARGKWALALVERASRRASAADVEGALDDLDVAERYGAAPDVLAATRLRLAEQLTEEIRSDLEAGEPDRVVDRIDALARRKVASPALRRLREAAEAWRAALAESRRGEFGRAFDALERAERLAGETVKAAIASARRSLEERRTAAAPKVDRFYRAFAAEPQDWAAILAVAEDVLQDMPDHPAARDARVRAWQRIGAVNPDATSGPRPPSSAGAPPVKLAANREIVFLDETAAEARSPAARTAAAASPEPKPRSKYGGPDGRFLLWADAIGGYLVCLDDRVTIGRAGPDSSAEIALLGDLARRHAAILRQGENYLIESSAPTFVNGRRVGSAPLRDGDVIRLGSTVELEFRRPSPVTSTATLRLLSRHRPPMAVDGMILMAQSCLIGRTRQCHIPAPRLEQPVVLFRQADALWCRCPGGFQVDDRPALSRARLTTRSNVQGEGFSFSLEPLETPGATTSPA